jgi:hypothetical protein
MANENSEHPMKPDTVTKSTVSFGVALAVASVANALLVVLKEKNPAVMGEMKKLTGHHWSTHVVIVLVIFFVCGWLFSTKKGGQGLGLNVSQLIKTILGGVVLGGLIIVGFCLFAA